jgi:hypothetical protein
MAFALVGATIYNGGSGLCPGGENYALQFVLQFPFEESLILLRSGLSGLPV